MTATLPSRPGDQARALRPTRSTERGQALPGHRPKPCTDDPTAPEAVRTILCSPSYRRADEDVDFLQRNDTRGVRLQLDYLKAERLLEDHNIAHTINGFSAHADQRDLLSWHGCVKGKAVTFLVHGEELVMEKFANRLQRTSVTLPKLHQSFDL